MSKIALVRRPSPSLDEGIVTHIARKPVDYVLACRQWAGYVDALAGNGWGIVEVPPADDCPDSVFVEDAVVAYGNVAVLTRPGPRLAAPRSTGSRRSSRISAGRWRGSPPRRPSTAGTC